MSRYIDVPCPTAPAPEDSKALAGSRWLHNREVKKWYLVKSCPLCKDVHAPENIRPDKLVVTSA